MGSLDSAGPVPQVLLTNDDGPDSPFFQQWLEHVRDNLRYIFACVDGVSRRYCVQSTLAIIRVRWECASVVPTTHCSAMGKALAKQPFKVERTGDAHWLAAAPPATCVNLGCFTLFPSTNFVIAGPDVGQNVGRAMLLSSATIGAAMEAALCDRKAIALSFAYYRRFGSWTPAELTAAIQVCHRIRLFSTHRLHVTVGWRSVQAVLGRLAFGCR